MARKNANAQNQTEDNPAQAGVDAAAPTGNGDTPATAIVGSKGAAEKNPHAEHGGTREDTHGGDEAAKAPAPPVVPDIGSDDLGKDGGPGGPPHLDALHTVGGTPGPEVRGTQQEGTQQEDAAAQALKARLKQERIDAAREDCLANNAALVAAMLAKDKALAQMDAGINQLQARGVELNRVYNEALNG